MRVSNGGGGRVYNPLCEGRDNTSPDTRCVLADHANHLSFYMLHNQGLTGSYVSEIRDSTNVDVFATKSENTALNALGVVRSDNVWVFGYSGNYQGRPDGGSAAMEVVGGSNIGLANIAPSTAANRVPTYPFYLVRECAADAGAGCLTGLSSIAYLSATQAPDASTIPANGPRPAVLFLEGTPTLWQLP
jgi:hypothetical protein